MKRLTGLEAGDPELEAELDEIRANLEAERALGESSYADCFKASHNRIAMRTMTGIAIQGFQQVSTLLIIIPPPY